MDPTLGSFAGLNTTGHRLGDSVLLVIDAQQEYVDGALVLPDVSQTTENMVRLLNAARSASTPVIHVVHLGTGGGVFDPSDRGRIIEAVGPVGAELVIMKRLPNSFAGTDLDEQLRLIGRPCLIIAGFMTHMCVSATARSALDHGYDCTVVSDATATRALPDPTGAGILASDVIHVAALAALADRFAAVVTTDVVVAP